MTEQNAIGANPDPDFRLKFPQPGFVMVIGVPKSVVVRDPGEIVIARIGVTALAIRKSVSDRVIVVSLNDRNSGFAQNLAHSIRQRAECAEIPETVQVLNLGRSGILQQSF